LGDGGPAIMRTK